MGGPAGLADRGEGGGMSAPDGAPAAAAAAIAQFHDFLEAWLSGRMAADEAAVDAALASFDEAFVCVHPSGARQSRGDLRRWLEGTHGARPGLRIEIAGAEALWASGDAMLIDYEERQTGFSPNVRRATALFAVAGGGVRWVHVSERWIGDAP